MCVWAKQAKLLPKSKKLKLRVSSSDKREQQAALYALSIWPSDKVQFGLIWQLMRWDSRLSSLSSNVRWRHLAESFRSRVNHFGQQEGESCRGREGEGGERGGGRDVEGEIGWLSAGPLAPEREKSEIERVGEGQLNLHPKNCHIKAWNGAAGAKTSCEL